MMHIGSSEDEKEESGERRRLLAEEGPPSRQTSYRSLSSQGHGSLLGGSLGQGGSRGSLGGCPSPGGPVGPAPGWVAGWAAGQVRKASMTRTRSIGERLARGISVADLQDEGHISLTWHNLSVSCPQQTGASTEVCAGGPCAGGCCGADGELTMKKILNNVSGMVGPGTLTAIMGSSGAGKTTLLNVLNQRNISGLSIEGDVKVNGEKLGRGITAISSFVQQDDLFVGILKVREHLWFQSMLRMDSEVSNFDRTMRVDAIMDELGLMKCADAQIGTPGKKKSISGGEMKRLSFASELLTNPALLFCDEPTSGLDSFMAHSVIQTLREQSEGGKTVMFTIHQPSSEVYALFENIIFMSEGRIAYMGPVKDANRFFEEQGYICPSNFNPADFFISTLAIHPHEEMECKRRVWNICEGYENSSYFEEMMIDVNKAEVSQHYTEEIETLMEKSP